MQDVPAAAQGGALTFGAVKLAGDKWFLGGDVRQTRLTFNIRGPEVLGGATPLGVVEMDLGGYNYQILAANGITASANRFADMNGNLMPNTQILAYNTVTNEPRFDESLVPRIRLAYIELNWGNSQNVLRVGQYHNLLLGMIPGSASHIATPLGYGAGQLGWRSPSITYIHRFAMSATSNLDIGVQVNRNSWRDELPNCTQSYSPSLPGAMPTTQAPAQNCLPYGISAGEASMLPQVEARIMAFGGMAEAPLPFYLPTKWQFYIVGHWDKKDLSGVGNTFDPAAIVLPGTTARYRDSMDTMVAQAGFKFQLGPVLVAANGWYGKNAGNVFGHIFQMQDLNRPDISGFGAWGQIGIGLTKGLSLWAFGGIDKPNEQDIINSFGVVGQVGRLSNVQLAAQLVYTEGPIQIGVEYIMVMTKNYYAGIPGTPIAAIAETYSVSQPSLVLNYNF